MSDEQKVGEYDKDEVPHDLTDFVPVDLEQSWRWGKAVTGKEEDLVGFTSDQGGGGGGGGGGGDDRLTKIAPNGPQQPDLSFLDVSPGQIRDAETAILMATATQIEDFERFRDSAMAKANWIFWASSEEDAKLVKHNAMHINPPNQHWQGTQTDGTDGIYASYKDPHPEQTQELQYAQIQLLQGCGGVLELVGQFVGRLNNAAQIYASADINSTVPDGTSTA
ncbi:hypothetical protein [Micromonospora sp. WMMD1219]|uniref:hypothetical protein n=1 Tax=Micromonospora sp. WMMD1219 TaxID=3404115 RepID=UPI003BF60814